MDEARLKLAIAIERANELANHPQIRPHLSGPEDAPIDLTAFFENPLNVACFEGSGLVLFAAIPGKPGWYDTHYLFPRSPYKDTLAAVRRAVETMFATESALVLCGMTPRENRAARSLNRALGTKKVGEGLTPGGRSCIMYAMERKTWARLSGGYSVLRATTSAQRKPQRPKNTPPTRPPVQPALASTG